VDDAVDAYLAAWAHIGRVSGQAFNLGGGPANAASVVEVLELIGKLTGAAPEIAWDSWRVADQRYYVSDTSAFEQLTRWRPRVAVPAGLERLHAWLAGAREDRRQQLVAAVGGG
jgi:CDP-paratose 2-epimerase